MRFTDALTLHGITSRQLDYWCRRGHLRVHSAGIGHPRVIPESEQPILALFVDLTRAGFTLEAAAGIARRLTNHSPLTITSGALTATLTLEPPDGT